MLFRWVKDRLQYLRRLREASLRHSASVLNYMVTGNHVHLLLRADSPGSVAHAMQYLSGCVAQDYNRRKKREGAFWRGRYRPTLVESGAHLTRCFFYIEFNMVRAGVVRHPEEWVGGAFREHSGQRKRYRIIDRSALLNCLECPAPDRFQDWYLETLRQQCRAGYHAREPWWTGAAAVGSKAWILRVAGCLPRSRCEIERAPAVNREVGKETGTYLLHMSDRTREGLLGMLAERVP